jgi:hypothetical protein
MDPSHAHALTPYNEGNNMHHSGGGSDGHEMAHDPKSTPMSIATISSGFEKGDFLVREEKGQRVYFDFFEEAFNSIAYKGRSL